MCANWKVLAAAMAALAGLGGALLTIAASAEDSATPKYRYDPTWPHELPNNNARVVFSAGTVVPAARASSSMAARRPYAIWRGRLADFLAKSN